MTTGALQGHPLLRNLLHTGKLDVPWVVALRNTAAIVLPLLIAELAGQRSMGLAVAAGALNTMFADQPGPYRLRMQRMLMTALAAGVAASAGAYLGQWRDALLVVAALWGFCGALLVAVGPHATRAGLISMILLMVMGSEPQPPLLALGAGLLIFAGGVLQTSFAVIAWPLQRYRPERMALAAAFDELAALARRVPRSADDTPLPPSLNDLQTLLHGRGSARGRAVEAFRVLVELAERARIELTALDDLEASNESPPLRQALRQLGDAAAGLLDGVALALANAAPPKVEFAVAALATATAAIEQIAHAEASAEACIAVARAQALGGQLRAVARNADVAGSRGEIRARRAEFALPRALQAANPLEALRANLRLESPAFRHAIRCGACLALALALSYVLPLSRGYWMPMTVAIVLKPDFGATWRYGLLRVAGTLGGLLFTTALLQLPGVDTFWVEWGVLTVLCFAYRELAAYHYGIAVVCLTGLVVILLSFYGIPAETAVHARAVDTALGSALALLAYFLWPTWERGRERETLAQMLDAYRDYLLAVLQGNPRERHETRIAARTARSTAQASLDRLRNEPTGQPYVPRAEGLVAQANRLVRVAMLLEAARHDQAGEHTTPELAPFAQACGSALRDCALALREARAPTAAWQLRACQRTLIEQLNAARATSAWSAAVRDASDRIVDAIDSVAHVLAQPRP